MLALLDHAADRGARLATRTTRQRGRASNLRVRDRSGDKQYSAYVGIKTAIQHGFLEKKLKSFRCKLNPKNTDLLCQ